MPDAFVEFGDSAVGGAVTAGLGYHVNRSMAAVCFGAGVPIRTTLGSVPIQALKVGDLVLSRDEMNPDGPVEARRVEEVFARTAPVLTLVVGGRKITTTGEHPFYSLTRGAWVPARELAAGEVLAGEAEPVAVEGVEDEGRWEAVYNVRVEGWHTYFVGCPEWGFGVWAHNRYDIDEGGNNDALNAQRRAQVEADLTPIVGAARAAWLADLGAANHTDGRVLMQRMNMIRDIHDPAVGTPQQTRDTLMGRVIVDMTLQDPGIHWANAGPAGQPPAGYGGPSHIPGAWHEVPTASQNSPTLPVWRSSANGTTPAGEAYWCHAVPFGGDTAQAGRFSPGSGSRLRSFVNEMYDVVPRSQARPGDVLVWHNDPWYGTLPHTAVLTEPVMQSGGRAFDYRQTRIQTKNGVNVAEVNITLHELMNGTNYGNRFDVYRRSGT